MNNIEDIIKYYQKNKSNSETLLDFHVTNVLANGLNKESFYKESLKLFNEFVGVSVREQLHKAYTPILTVYLSQTKDLIFWDKEVIADDDLSNTPPLIRLSNLKYEFNYEIYECPVDLVLPVVLNFNHIMVYSCYRSITEKIQNEYYDRCINIIYKSS